MVRAERVGTFEDLPSDVLRPQGVQWGRGVVSAEAALEVWDLYSGRCLRRFRRPVPLGRAERFSESVAPDLTFAVMVGEQTVWAVEPGGRVRWRYGMGPLHCDVRNDASVHVSADQRVVWGALGAPPGTVRDPDDEPCDEWVALEASTGAVVGRALLAVNQHPFQIPHPDGVHMLVAHSEWLGAARLDGSDVHAFGLDDPDRRWWYLADVSPDGSFLSGDELHQGLYRCSFPDGRPLAELPAVEHDGFPPPQTFVDCEHVITVAYAADGAHAEPHVLIRAGDMAPIGPITYPEDSTHGETPRGLGDASWLTVPRRGGPVRRWRRTQRPDRRPSESHMRRPVRASRRC